MNAQAKIKPPDRHTELTPQCAFDLTAIMRREGIQRFYWDGRDGFAVAFHDGRYGTGADVGEAWRNAIADERVAA